jgi:hypothetical protein
MADKGIPEYATLPILSTNAVRQRKRPPPFGSGLRLAQTLKPSGQDVG